MTLDQWADLALIFLLCQAFLVSLGVGIGLFYTVRGLASFDRELRVRLPILRKRAKEAASATEALGEAITGPIITASSQLAQAQRVIESLSSSLKHKGRG